MKFKAVMRRIFLRLLFTLILSVLGLELVLQLAHFLAEKREGKGVRESAGVILCVGDSHTFGAGVKKEESYPAQLEQELLAQGYPVQVINLGAPGYNTSELRQQLPKWLKTYSPVAVIILAGVNNGWNRAAAAWSDAQDGLHPPFLTQLAERVKSNVRIVHGLTVLLHRLEWAGPAEERAKDREGRTIIHQQEETREAPEITYQRARRDLVAMIALIRAHHATPLLMTYVTDPHFTFETPNQLLREVARTMNVTLADNDQALRPLFITSTGEVLLEKRNQLFFEDMHPRADGYRYIAANVILALQKAGVLNTLPKKREAPLP